MIIKAALPWELSLTIGDKDYQTRPLRVADVAALGRFDQLSDEEGFALLQNFFVAPGPDLKALSESGTIGAMELTGIAQAVSEYFKASMEKKTPRPSPPRSRRRWRATRRGGAGGGGADRG
jgi:hypothetical protein